MKKNTKKRKLKVQAMLPGGQVLPGTGQSLYDIRVPSFQAPSAPTLQDYYNNLQMQLKLGETAGMYELKYGTDPNDERLYDFTLQALKNNAGNAYKLAQIDSIVEGISNKGKSSGLGGMDIAGAASALPGALETLTSPFQTSTATTGGEAAMQSIMGIGKGAASGALLGMAVGGPLGAGIGAGVGAAVGLIGKKGRKAGMSSFVDFDEGTLGTGLIGAFSNKKLRRRRAAIRLNAFSNREGVAGTERLANNFNENNMEVDTNTYAYGGSSNSSLAYVDDGEVMKTPDGLIVRVPERGKPTDSNLVNLPDGTRILSNTLKVPGTNKTFAEMGDKMITKRKSKGNDIYALNAAKLNEMNNSMVHDKLFAMQEMVKAKKGIKPKSKELVPAASGGGLTGDETSTIKQWAITNKPFKYRKNGVYDPGYENFLKNYLTQSMLDSAMQYNPDIFARFRASNPNVKPTVLLAIQWGLDGDISDFHNGLEWIYDNRKILQDKPENPLGRIKHPQEYYASNTRMAGLGDALLSHADLVEKLQYPFSPSGKATPRDNKDGDDKGNDKKPFDWAQLAGDITALAPILSNLFTNKPESVPAIYNPYATAITNTMGRRRYNIDPLLRDIEANRNVANYNASQYRTNTGHDMAFRLQSAIAANKAKAMARADESNVNNQYRADYANVMNNLGQQWVGATNLNLDLNAQNRATARNINRTGLSQLSQFAQNKILMRNQDRRDKAMLELYKPFLQSGFTSDAITNWNRYLS